MKVTRQQVCQATIGLVAPPIVLAIAGVILSGVGLLIVYLGESIVSGVGLPPVKSKGDYIAMFMVLCLFIFVWWLIGMGLAALAKKWGVCK